MLSNTIDEKGDIDEVIKRFMKKLIGCIAINFQKKRVTNKVISQKHTDLYERMIYHKSKHDDVSKAELDEVVKEIAKVESANFNKLKDELGKLKKGDDEIDSKQLWKLKRKMCPRSRDAPCAMKDANENLVTSDKALQKEALEVFSKRLEGNKIEPHLKDLEDDTNTLCEIRVKLSKSHKSAEWTMEDLKLVLKHLDKLDMYWILDM